MKKITQFQFGKVAIIRSLKRIGIICLGLISSSSMVFATTQYCSAPINSINGNSQLAYITCQSLGGGQYEFKFVAQNDITTWNAAGSNFYMEVNGVGGYHVSEHLVKSSDNKTLSVIITSSVAPNIYVGDLFVNFSDGEHHFVIPTDENFTVTCPTSGPTDTTAPVMGTATVQGTPTYSSVVLQLSALDETTTPVVNFVANDAANGITNKAIVADATGKATVIGLNPSTNYNFVITAKDAAFNTSANSATVSFTTAARTSQCSGDKGHFGNPSATKIHYAITTSGTSVTHTVTPIESGRTLSFVELHACGNVTGSYGMTIASDGLSATYTQTGLTVGQPLGIRYMYKLDNMPGNEMTSEAVSMADANIIYYVIGDECTVTAVSNPTIQALSLSPNPAKDQLQIRTVGNMAQVVIRNLVGQVIKSEIVKTDEVTIDLTNIIAGNYIVSVQMANGKLAVKKIVKL